PGEPSKDVRGLPGRSAKIQRVSAHLAHTDTGTSSANIQGTSADSQTLVGEFLGVSATLGFELTTRQGFYTFGSCRIHKRAGGSDPAERLAQKSGVTSTRLARGMSDASDAIGQRPH